MNNKVVYTNEIEIFTQSFGERSNPAVILIMGATAQGLMWPNSFCESLADLGLFVIRYDHRDTGQSSRIDYCAKPYYLYDLASDVLAILDSYQIDRAHFIGASMGGQIAQNIAINYPERVMSLTCIMSTPNHLVFVDGFEGKDTTNHDLPASDQQILRYYQAILGIKATTPQEANIMYERALKEIMSLPEHLVETRIFEGKILKRLKSLTHVHNHSIAMASSKDLHDDLHKIKARALIIHGKDDFILPVAHGRKLAQLIAGATFIEYENMGHSFNAMIFNKLLKDLKQFLSFKNTV
jgi:pimeloyl-ACP methyl ester carboxylesterase